MNIKNFKKWGMERMSYSRLNSFKNYPSQFVINRIYGYDTGSSPAMSCGNVVEDMLHNYMQGNDINLSSILESFAEKFADYHKQEDVIKYLELIPKFYKNCEALFNKMGNYKLHSYQEELHTEILGIPFLGYSDFVFDMGDELFVYDLKTKGRMSIKHSDKLQQWIYKKALEEKYDKPVTCHLYIVTPTKHHFEEIIFNYSHEVEIDNILKGMNKVFEFCDDKKDFAFLYQPNLDDFIWNNPQIIQARKEIWGI